MMLTKHEREELREAATRAMPSWNHWQRATSVACTDYSNTANPFIVRDLLDRLDEADAAIKQTAEITMTLKPLIAYCVKYKEK